MDGEMRISERMDGLAHGWTDDEGPVRLNNLVKSEAKCHTIEKFDG